MPPNEFALQWENWFAAQGWEPLSFQRDTWRAFARKESGLLHMPTGTGKTYAVYGGALEDALSHPSNSTQILYLTPLRALSRDIEKALRAPLDALGLPLRLAMRTGDTSSYQRTKQKKEKPHILVTTPESLAVLLSQESSPQDFKHLRTLIIDEWHELIGTKRGSLLELCAARLRRLAPSLKTWALSATLANVEEAAQTGVGVGPTPTVITARLERDIQIETILPDHVDRFPWAGHLGLKMLPKVIEALSLNESTLIFTNTRSQAERWYSALREAKPEWNDFMALHHGSLAREERERVEEGLKSGMLRLAVCTSSLDLGIDLAPVERAVQIGSPKGIGRLIQRAGRASHSPGLSCRIFFVPTHALELIEIAAVRNAIRQHTVEARRPLQQPLDVLSQHLVTLAMGGGFSTPEVLHEIRSAWSFRDVTDQAFEWAMTLVQEGGSVLRAYPHFHKVREKDGRYVIGSPQIARQHRLNIGTITSDTAVQLKFKRGRTLGNVEESFIARLKRGDVFLFGGQTLELILVRDLIAYVRKANKKPNQTPRWYGGKMPLSASLAAAMRNLLGEIAQIDGTAAELKAVAPVLETQRQLSVVPGPQEILVERCRSREGEHLFLFPFEGRLVHEGLAALLAYRMAKQESTTFSLTVNDYGIEFLAPAHYPFELVFSPRLFAKDRFVDDVLHAVNLGELAKRQFREIARVAGLVAQNYPGTHKTSRQVQVSSSLLFDVFQRYDPDNPLLAQARREVLEQHFEQIRLTAALERIGSTPLRVQRVRHATPLAFPLVAERLGAKLFSTETLEQRIERITRSWVLEASKKKHSVLKEKISSSLPTALYSGQTKAC